MQHFSVSIYIATIHINVPETQYNCFKETLCMQTLYFTLLKAAVS